MRIVIENLSKDIKKVPVLTDINIEFEGGYVYGLKGKNGSGKTMLMRAVCGLIRPTKGRILIDDKELGKDISFPESIGVLIENPAFIDSYTGFKNLKVLASIKGKVSDEEIRDTLKQVGLDSDDKRTFRKYSLGMKQRLGIAAAIMENPDIVILDEPINALDESGAKQVRDILSDRKAKGALIIIACHDTEELEYLCDKIYTISEGKIVGE